MKIREYNQMMRYLTSTGEFAKNRKIEVKPKKTGEVIDVDFDKGKNRCINLYK